MDGSWKYINLSQIYEYRNWETDHYNSVLEIKRLHSLISGNTYMGTQPDIYIEFSPALHSQCGSCNICVTKRSIVLWCVCNQRMWLNGAVSYPFTGSFKTQVLRVTNKWKSYYCPLKWTSVKQDHLPSNVQLRINMVLWCSRYRIHFSSSSTVQKLSPIHDVSYILTSVPLQPSSPSLPGSPAGPCSPGIPLMPGKPGIPILPRSPFRPRGPWNQRGYYK